MARDYVSVFDGGGTNVRHAIVAENGDIITLCTELCDFLHGNEGYRAQLERMERQDIEKAGIKPDDVAGRASAFAGPYNRSTGVINAPNAKLKGLTIVDDLRILRECNLNDVGAASYGVYRFDSDAEAYLKRPPEEVGDAWVVSYCTISTGTNTVPTVAFESDGMKIARITDGVEAGHYILDRRTKARKCGCGQYGCAEAYISATALINRIVEELEGGINSNLPVEATRLFAGKGGDDFDEEGIRKMYPPVMYRMLMEGRETGIWQPIADEVSDALALHIHNITCVQHPGVLKFGGSMMRDADLILAPAMDKFRKRVKIYRDELPAIGLANFRDSTDIDNMPLRGCAAYFFDRYRSTKTMI